ncbi:unnamed protein product [Spirodela intermedia]|uniref:Uncharacterized protein n=1 Tax=Spirodela intermedia TaxID=51605 RepID=A0A7I8IYK2_SPIIN|nr:unnamed protein product [Spirodela intermedia]CAA6662879.1 unnamed protein product [Spirodela intermedia]
MCPQMPQSRLLSGTSSSSSSSDGDLASSSSPGSSRRRQSRGPRRDGCCARRKAGAVASAARGEQDHYAVLGISRRASAADYHPDVSQDARAGELFKSIHLAYESRAAAGWASRQGGGERRRRSSDTERGPFGEVLWSTFFSLFLMRAVGARISLTVTGLLALFDPRLDGGYKMATSQPSPLQAGMGKSSSGIVALAVLVMWVSGRLAATVPLPQGAILTLLYMSMKLQSDDPK